jgi:hypothetical protein
LAEERKETRMLIAQPMVQVGMLLLGLGMLWWEVRSIRRKIALDEADREMILAHRLKGLLGSALLVVLGVSLLLASAGLISVRAAHHGVTGAAFLALGAALYLLVCNTPRWVWRWIDRR